MYEWHTKRLTKGNSWSNFALAFGTQVARTVGMRPTFKRPRPPLSSSTCSGPRQVSSVGSPFVAIEASSGSMRC